MLKNVQKNASKYQTNSKVSNSQSEWNEQCYTFGYLDGYFEESVYIECIINTNNKEKKIEIYNKGYEKGTKDGKRIKLYEPKVYKEDRLTWIKALALHDALNNVENRNFKEETSALYETYQNGVFSLGKMNFVNPNRFNNTKKL